MGLLFDTDAFCKLGATGLLEAAAEVFGCKLVTCARLPALPHMLRRGRLRKRFGDVVCDALLPIARTMQVAPPVSVALLDPLRGIPDIDPGEAHLLAVVAERGVFLLTADKRALRAVASLPAVARGIAGKVVVLEAVMLELCRRKGEAFVRSCVSRAPHVDTIFQVCFSSGNPDARAALKVYVEDCRRELEVLALWVGSG